MSEKLAEIPDYVYRAITVPAAEFHDGLLSQDLTTTTQPIFDEQGRPTVADGNEYGIYTSTNQHMAEVAYGTPRHEDTLPDSPKFAKPGAQHASVGMPRVGITYKIKTDGLELRKPFITGSLQEVYNNGFEGDELIADHIPAENVSIARLSVGRDLLHNAEHFHPEGEDHTLAAEILKAELGTRAGRLAMAAETIRELSEPRRANPSAVDRAIRPLKAPGKF